MTPGCTRAFRLLAAAIAALACGAALRPLAPAAHAQPPEAHALEASSQPPFSILDDYEPLTASRDRGDVLSTLRPIVCRFDFDSSGTGPNALPPNFYRYIAPSQGFPPFGEMRVAQGAGYSDGRDSDSPAGALEFALAGGSMSARIGPSVIPVLPYADYIVACRTRTGGLKHSKTRLVAWLCDGAGREIPGSRNESRCTNTAGAWDTLSLEIHGHFAEAADLVFELQLAQPQHQSAQRLDATPQVEDVAGRAWFDDVTISHMPRVTLTMEPGDGVITLGEPVEFQVQANEVATSDLRARLRAFDLDGHTVFDQVFPAPRGRQSAAIAAPIAACGWYRAVLDITGQGSIARRRWLDFVVLPAQQRETNGRHNPFGVAIGDMRAAAASAEPDLLTALNASMAIVPGWERETTLANLPQQTLTRRLLTDQLLRRGIDVHFSLATIPDELARSAGPDGRTVLDVLAHDSRAWQPYLEDLLLQYGLTVGGWQVGRSEDIAAGDLDGLPERLRRATEALAAYAPKPKLHIAWPVAQPAMNPAEAPAMAVFVPRHAQPSAIADFLEPWIVQTDRSTTVTLELLPTAAYTPRQRVTDALLRGLHAWRAGAKAIIIDQPWSAVGDDDLCIVPRPEFTAWRTLASQLAGREFVAELNLGQGIHAWVARGRDASDAALIAWCDRPESAGSQPLQIQLSDGAVEIIDAFGNARSLPPDRAGMHIVDLGELPTFIQHVSLELVMFRSGVRLDPEFIPAASRIHEHHIVIRNPWDSMIAGSIRLVSDADLALSPSVQEFSIAPRGEVRLPLAIVPQRGILAGRKTIKAEVTVNADRLHTLAMQLDVEVGLKGIELNATWASLFNPATGVDDLIISPAVTNHSSQIVTLDVDLLAEGVSQTRRTLAGLQPGQTQTRTFRIANGVALLSNKQIRLGVAERDGVARLNKVITITPRRE
jgi:hypothetical protein